MSLGVGVGVVSTLGAATLLLLLLLRCVSRGSVSMRV